MASTTVHTPTRTTSTTASPTCTTAVPGKYGHVPFDACNSNYNDDPSFEANLAFAALFGASFVIHIVQAIAYKKRFCWVVIMGAAWETAAFALRTIGARNQQALVYAILGQILFLLSPLWINAFAYMTVARMIYFGLPEKKIWGIKAVRLTTLFVWLDIVCFLVQLGGGGLLSNNGNAKLIQIGMKVYTAGIGIQLGFVVIFGGMTVSFYYRMHQVSGGGGRMGRMRYLIWALLAVLALIVVRIVFRLIEFGPGLNSSNKYVTNELYPLLLDAMPMTIALILLNVMHPGLVLKGPDGEFPRLSRREKKALKKERKEEKRRRKEEKKAGKLGGFKPEVDSGDDMVRLAPGSRGYHGSSGGGGGRRGHDSWELRSMNTQHQQWGYATDIPAHERV